MNKLKAFFAIIDDIWEKVKDFFSFLDFDPYQRRNISVGIVVLSMLVGFLLSGPVDNTKGLGVTKVQSVLPVEPAVVQTKSGKMHKFELEIASAPVDVEIALMYRTGMALDHGMLLQTSRKPAIASVRMKNTPLTLDMLFVEADGTIAGIHSRAVPYSMEYISSTKPVTGVIEIHGGRAGQLGIAPGDKVVHPYFSK